MDAVPPDLPRVRLTVAWADGMTNAGGLSAHVVAQIVTPLWSIEPVFGAELHLIAVKEDYTDGL